jgi:monovalent cation/proton antiporter MnhG/PhaG subunit
MTVISQIVALLLLLTGVGFVVAASIGVLRFSDTLQRMHAATKAGTLGAVLVIAGAMVALDPDAVPVGIMAIVFMMLTVPIAAHLLGRAAYISGTPLRMAFGRDALFGVLHRQGSPLEQRTEFLAYAAPGGPSQAPSPSISVEAISEIRLAVIGPDVTAPLERALAIRAGIKVPLKALAIIDTRFVAATADPKDARIKVRANLTRAIEEVESRLPKRRSFFSLSYEEGDPYQLIPASENPSSLLVLPSAGWCHHGVDIATPMATGRPEGLLRLADHHAGGVLFVGRKPMAKSPLILVDDDGSDAIAHGVSWALANKIWRSERLLLVSRCQENRRVMFEELAQRYGKAIETDFVSLKPGEPLPTQLAIADGLITTSLSGPKRTDWYGSFWHDRIAPGWTGEVVIVPS